MTVLTGRKIVTELGSWFAEQLGVDPKDVLGIDLHFHMNDIATADVRLTVKEGEIAEELRRYTLVRLEDEVKDGH